MNIEKIKANLDFPASLIKGDADGAIADALERRTLGFKAVDALTETYGISDGLALAICKAVKEQRKLNSGAGSNVSREDARADRVLRIRDSSGRATARRRS